MNNETKECVELFKEIRTEVGSDEAACGILEQIKKDHRVKAMTMNSFHSKGVNVSFDNSATAKQIAYLKTLKVDTPLNVTRDQASELIDRARAT